MNKKLLISLVIILLVLSAFIAFLYPKHRVIGGAKGLIGEGIPYYREDYSFLWFQT
jgi:hypothetical protein